MRKEVEAMHTFRQISDILKLYFCLIRVLFSIEVYFIKLTTFFSRGWCVLE